jgi:hypothetical protein
LKTFASNLVTKLRDSYLCNSNRKMFWERSWNA